MLFLKDRAIPQLEWVNDDSYQRLITYGNIRGWFKAAQNQQGKITVEFKLNKTANIMEFVARLKIIFDWIVIQWLLKIILNRIAS